jgi:hypothetical protein
MRDMKSHAEILMESRRLEQLGAQFADDTRRARAMMSEPLPSPRIVMTFPDSVVAHRSDPNDDDALETTITRRRWIEAAWDDGAVEYRLTEDETETAPWGEVVRESGPSYVIGSDSAFDALVEGYELGEQERLGHLLAPYAERGETGELLDAVDPALIREVELIIGSDDFPVASRIAAKGGIIAFLEGRIDASEFIGAAISRGLYRNLQAESIDRRVGERVAIDQP